MSWANLAGELPNLHAAAPGGGTLDASALPLTRVGGLTAAAQSFHAQDRARRTSAEQMSDGAGGGQAGSFALPTLGDFGSMLKRGGIALALGGVGVLGVPVRAPPAPPRGPRRPLPAPTPRAPPA